MERGAGAWQQDRITVPAHARDTASNSPSISTRNCSALRDVPITSVSMLLKRRDDDILVKPPYVVRHGFMPRATTMVVDAFQADFDLDQKPMSALRLHAVVQHHPPVLVLEVVAVEQVDLVS